MGWTRWISCVVLVAGGVGCDSNLDTDYKPHRLNSTSENDRRSFYAPAFTPESQPTKDNSAPDVMQHGPGRY